MANSPRASTTVPNPSSITSSSVVFSWNEWMMPSTSWTSNRSFMSEAPGEGTTSDRDAALPLARTRVLSADHSRPHSHDPYHARALKRLGSPDQWISDRITVNLSHHVQLSPRPTQGHQAYTWYRIAPIQFSSLLSFRRFSWSTMKLTPFSSSP